MIWKVSAECTPAGVRLTLNSSLRAAPGTDVELNITFIFVSFRVRNPRFSALVGLFDLVVIRVVN